ncbi:unnamed protein product [Peronospora effusa]|uniref:F-box domain-containing protein n=1 Tax=Peronospora effusa TaxID=542832 RepID=A0A3M6VPP7_9STRA|nr:hypothetical protein DD238_006581 [Peronospora effusa]CAI5702877.1 unnamed protein product [Peronospora effusa]
MLQQRQCRDKIRALRDVRERIHFYPLLDKQEETCYSMQIFTNMILSKEVLDWQYDDDRSHTNAHENVGIDALGSLEMLLFAFFSRQELLCVSGVCTAWKALARDDLFWEPMLFTSLEKYPIRSLLGLERESTQQQDVVPAILVYMVYQKLQLAQVASSKCSDNAAITADAAATRNNGHFLELLQPLHRQRQAGPLSQIRRVCRGRRDEATMCVHLVCVKFNSTASTLGMPEAQMAAGLHLEDQREDQGAPTAGVLNEAIAVPDEQRPVAMNAQNGANAAEDEDVYSVADGRDRVTLSAWLSTNKRVNERILRSFLRQLLLAVLTLERSNYEHADISPVNIVVHCQPRNKTTLPQNGSASANLQVERDESEEMDQGSDASVDIPAVHNAVAKAMQDNRQRCRRRTPFFQLFISRRNCHHIGGTRGRALDPVLAMDVERNIHRPNGDGFHAIAQQRQIPAGARPEVADDAGVLANGGDRGAMPFPLRHRHAFAHPNMVSSVIQTAMIVWARGRFAHANASSVLTQLLRFPDSFSSSLRSFLEYATYLIITHSATAFKLLRHDYLQCPAARLDLHSSPSHWSRTSISDVNKYKRELIAYYGTLSSRVEEFPNESMSVSPLVMDELMPRTNLGTQYFSEALEEATLPTKRFVSVVAPPTASSSWVRKLARTQTCTLQRLDLSHVRMPMSVLLQELATLPRLTHLRLPKQILRDDNMEHLVAALAYADLLPHLRGLDTIVRQAMDRMENSYLMQLDMVTFLLRKPSTSCRNLGK